LTDYLAGIILGSFLGDSLALGAHWVYDLDILNETIGKVDRLLDPKPDSYHPNRSAGEFTHIGDQSFLLLETLSGKNSLDIDDFSLKWREKFAGYDGYFDHATKETLENYESEASPLEAGSLSGELAGASRLAPVFSLNTDNLTDLVTAARDQTRMTHNNELVIGIAEFLTITTWHILRGERPLDAIYIALEGRFEETEIAALVKVGLDSRDEDTVSALKRMGQSCAANAAFPGAIHLIVKYENDFRKAMISNVMAGGDSAARGMAVGMILGASCGLSGLPQDWLKEMKTSDHILKLIEQEAK
jgi:ADP-ribosylglycohydrolase